MDTPSVTLTLPPDIYERAQEIARSSDVSLETILLRQIEQGIKNPFGSLPPDEQAELRALAYLSDDALWTIVREQMPGEKQARQQDLMDKNNSGSISDLEYDELKALVEQGQKLMLRKAQAGVLLRERGYEITPDSMNE